MKESTSDKNVMIPILLVAALAACGPQSTPALPPTQIPTRTALPTSPPPSTAIPSVELEETEFRSEQGGFAIRYPKGWEYEEEDTGVIFYESEEIMAEDFPSVPIVWIVSGELDELFGVVGEIKDSLSLVEAFLRDIDDADLEVSPPRDTTVGDRHATVTDLQGEENGRLIAGRIVGVYLENRGVLIFCLSLIEGWDRFIPTFEAMLDSASFFLPEIPVPETTPTPFSREASTGLIWRIGGEITYEEGTFSSLGGMDVGPEGNLYVADTGEGVFVISQDGEVLNDLGGNIIAATDIKLAADGTIYVTSWGENAVYVFSLEWEQVHKWGEVGQGEGQFGEFSPEYLAVCPDGRVYVADTNEDVNGNDLERIQVFDAEGTYLFQWSITEIDDFFGISGMDCDQEGTLYVSGFFGDYIMVFDAEGNHLQSLGRESLWTTGVQGIAVGPEGNLYVGTWDGWVGLLSPEGDLLAQWGLPFEGEGEMVEGQIYEVQGIAVDTAGYVYVGDLTGEYAYITKFVFQ